MDHLTKLSALLPMYGPVLLAFVLALAGSIASRKWGRLPAVWAAVAAGVGWAVLVPMVYKWALSPRSTVECLVLPAMGFAVADVVRLRVRSRWIGAAAVCFAAWWLALSPAALPQFWRVGFGAVLAAWLLGRVGAGGARRALVVAVTVEFGLLFGGAAVVWQMALAVLVVVGVGVWLAGRDAVVPSGLTMVGLVGADLGGGRLLRGGVGTVDLACLMAIAAPLLLPGVESGMRRQLGRCAGPVAVVLVGSGTAGLAWLLSRALRG